MKPKTKRSKFDVVIATRIAPEPKAFDQLDLRTQALLLRVKSQLRVLACDPRVSKHGKIRRGIRLLAAQLLRDDPIARQRFVDLVLDTFDVKKGELEPERIHAFIKSHLGHGDVAAPTVRRLYRLAKRVLRLSIDPNDPDGRPSPRGTPRKPGRLGGGAAAIDAASCKKKRSQGQAVKAPGDRKAAEARPRRRKLLPLDRALDDLFEAIAQALLSARQNRNR